MSISQSFELLRNSFQSCLLNLLNSVDGLKDLVIDPGLMRPLDRMVSFSFFKDAGVDKIYKLEPSQTFANKSRIYVIRPNLSTVKSISDQINAELRDNSDRKYYILMIPMKQYLCDLILEQEGVAGKVVVFDQSQSLEFFVLDDDLLSMELPEFFRSFYLDNDRVWLKSVAQSLVSLDLTFGPFRNVHVLGQAGKDAHKLMTSILSDLGQSGETSSSRQSNEPTVPTIIIVDREIDFVTPMCSSLTYGGLLDEVFGMESGFVVFQTEMTGNDKPLKWLCSSKDEVYREIRDRHFTNVFSYLSQKVKTVQSNYDKAQGLDIKGMKDFVSNDLKILKMTKHSLALHIGACEKIINDKTKTKFEEHLQTEYSILEETGHRENVEYIEEAINRQFLPISTLQQMCLVSLTQDGVNSKDYNALKTQFIQSYGFHHLLTFANLKKVGLFMEESSGTTGTALPLPKASDRLGKLSGRMAAQLPSMRKKSSYSNIRKKLNLAPKSAEDVDLKSPSDMSYVFGGAHTPIVARVTEQIMQKGDLSQLDEVIKHLPGEGYSRTIQAARGAGKAAKEEKKAVMIYYIGGVTHSELAALRLLAKLRGYQLIVATTAICNGGSMLSTLVEGGAPLGHAAKS